MRHNILFLVSLICCSAAASQPQTSLHDLKRVHNLRFHSESALVREAIEEEAAFREATKEEVRWYLKAIQESFNPSRRSLDDVRSNVLRRMKRDLDTVRRLNKEFAALSPMNDEITFSCKANRLAEFLVAAIDLFEQRGHLIILGLMPPEFDGYWDQVRCLGNCEHHRDSHNLLDLAFKASLVLTKLEIEGRTNVSDDVVKSLYDSPFLHVTPLPKGRILEHINELSLFYNGTSSPCEGELAFVHGGYAFGGQSQDRTFAHLGGDYGKRFGPQDCSSWVSKILRFPKIMSTVDFAALHRDQKGLEEEQCSSLNEFVVHEEVQQLQAVDTKSITDVQPGMVLVTRKYDLETDPTMSATLGSSGHAQLIIEVDEASNTLLTLEYARNLPDLEGFGVRRIPFAWQSDVKALFFTHSDH